MTITPLFELLHVGEHNARKLKISIENKYAGMDVKLVFFTPAGRSYLGDVTGFSSGEAEFALPSALLDAPGKLFAQLLVYKGRELLCKSRVSEFFVRPSADFHIPTELREQGLLSFCLLSDRIRDIGKRVFTVIGEDGEELTNGELLDAAAQAEAGLRLIILANEDGRHPVTQIEHTENGVVLTAEYVHGGEIKRISYTVSTLAEDADEAVGTPTVTTEALSAPAAEACGALRRNSSSLVAQMLDVAWSYYRVRGTEDNHRFVYGHTNAIDPGFTAGGNELDCSGLIGLMLRGIPYEHSRYVNISNGIGANGKYSWTVDPYDFENVNDAGEDPSPVRSAAQLGEWMNNSGLRISCGEDFQEVEPGDIIFYAKKKRENIEEWAEADRYMHISHVSVCANRIRPAAYNGGHAYNAGDFAYFDGTAASSLGIAPGIHECMVSDTSPSPDNDNWRFVVNGHYYHTMLEATDTDQVVMNRVLELNLPYRIVMICRPDLGAVTDGEFRGNLKTEFNIESLDDVWFDCFCFLTHEITGGLPELLRNTGDVADTGTGFALKTETTYRKNGQPYSIIQKIIDTRSIHNNEIYTRTKYLMISDGEYYRPDDPAAEWTDWNLLVNKEMLDTVMEANHLGQLTLNGTGHWTNTGGGSLGHSLRFGGKSFDGSAEKTITAADLNALTVPARSSLTSPSAITLADNTEYVLTGVSSLSFSYPSGNFECWIKLTTASSGTVTITFPSSTYIGDIPEFGNGETWEISIKDGVIIAGKVITGA